MFGHPVGYQNQASVQPHSALPPLSTQYISRLSQASNSCFSLPSLLRGTYYSPAKFYAMTFSPNKIPEKYFEMKHQLVTPESNC